MKLIVTCAHLVRHIEDYRLKLNNNSIKFKALYPTNQQFNEREMLKILPGNDFIIAGDDEISSKVIKESISKGLKAIIKWGIGVDNIDIKTAKKYNVPVFNTPNVFGAEVAEQTLSFILNLSRKTHIIDKEVRSGNWYKIEGLSLENKNLGLVGFGSIGKAIAKRAYSFGMKISFFDPFCDFNHNDHFSRISFDELCKSSDFIVLACSLNKENSKIINKNSISMMIKRPFIINVSRGQLINENDLIQGLKEKKIRGVGLDVFEKEPLSISSDLIKMDNCILGAHNSSNTTEAVKRVNDITIEMALYFKTKNIYEVFKDRRVV